MRIECRGCGQVVVGTERSFMPLRCPRCNTELARAFDGRRLELAVRERLYGRRSTRMPARMNAYLQ